MTAASRKHNRAFALIAVVLTFSVLFVPFTLDDGSDAAVGEPYTYTISTNGTTSGEYSPIGTSSTGKYTSIGGTNSGSWAFDENGYGPFNSFYAAFDPAQDNRMVGHLDPDDLSKLVDGTSVAGEDYNVMWCLPTVYWKVDGTSLILTNNPNIGGTAYAHQINGHVYEYIGIGVYEASSSTLDGQTILTSISGNMPLLYQTRATLRDYANNQLVNTDGNRNNGYAMVWNFYQWELYKYCTLAVIGSWDSQSVAGLGYVYNDGDSIYAMPGQLDQSGPYAGTKGTFNATYGTDPVKVFIENAWGSLSDIVDGIVFSDGEYYISQSDRPSDATSGPYLMHLSYSLPSSGWGTSPSTSARIWGMPTESERFERVDGLHDQVYFNSGIRTLYVGGNINCGLRAGMSYAAASLEPSETAGVAGRLAFVFDSDPMSSNTVTFISNGDVIDAQSVPTGLTAIAPSVELYGYVLQGWFTSDGIEFSPSLTITSDMTFIARWEGILQYTTDPISDGVVTAIIGQPGTVSFRATDSLYYSSVLWDFGDGTTSTDLYATHYYSEPGTYTASLTVYNNHGSDVTTYQIEVPSADPGDDGTEWALVAAVVLIAFVSGALIARRFL